MEEIEELRAKAIASMPPSSNPSAALKSKSPDSKEEGKLSSPFADAANGSKVGARNFLMQRPSGRTLAGLKSVTLHMELPACSTALLNSTVSEEPSTIDVVDNNAQMKSDCPAAKTLSFSSPIMANAQVRSSVTRNYSKQFQPMQVPFKSTNNQNPSWHGKGSDGNLVISFSDDDSGSRSEDSRLEKNIGRKDDTAGANKSRESKPENNISKKDDVTGGNKSEVPLACAPVPSRGLQRGPNRTKSVLKRGSENPAPIPSVTRATSSLAEKDSPIPRNNPNTKTSAIQEHAPVSDHRVASLRHKTALQENEIKVQSKLNPHSNEIKAGSYGNNPGPQTMLLPAKAGGVRRPASVSGIGLAPREQMPKRLKPAVGHDNKHGSASQLQFPISSSKSAHEYSSQLMKNRDSMGSCNINDEKQKHAADVITKASSESLLKMKDSRPIVPAPVTMCFTPAVASSHGNQSKSAVDDRERSDKSEKGVLAIDYPIIADNSSCLPQSDPNIDDGALRESNASLPRNLSTEQARHPNVSRLTDSSNPLPSKVPDQHGATRTQQIVSAAPARIPLETLKHISEMRIPEGKSGNNESLNLLNYSGQINNSGEASMNLQSLTELEDFHDKELEEAQELRHMCELEERRALQAYRKAQRALVAANEKCSLLYRKRELFSAQHRALLMQASGSMWPSSWQSQGATVSDSVETVPEASFNLLTSLGHQFPVECQILAQLDYEYNTRQLAEARPDGFCQQLNRHNFASGPFLEQGASTSNQRANSAADGVLTPAAHPNMSTDDNYVPVESRMAWETMEGNHGQTTADMDTEADRLPADENSQDYGLIEASLRSKLVQRLGYRISKKSNNIGERHHIFPERADKYGDTTKSPPLPDQQMQQGEGTIALELQGVERLGRSTNKLTAYCLSHDNGCSPDEAHWDMDSQDSNQLHSKATASTLPSSVLHVVSGHAISTLLDCVSELFINGKKEALLHEKFTEGSRDGESNIPSGIGFSKFNQMDVHDNDLVIDPFWPFCIFELRGKCNNEECRRQHIKHLKHNGQTSQFLSGGKFDGPFGPLNGHPHHILSIPIYHIGSNLIKIDSYLLRSVLARSIWQYWQRGFCASFCLPFSVQRILPPDAPFLQSGDGSVADDYSWNQLSLYYQALDSSEKQLFNGLPESEQSLEMALDLVDGSVCKPDRKKALCMLSRAIEADPTSVVLWIVYLHIYYGKEKNIGKDDMFLHAVQNIKDSYELWLMYINSRIQLSDRMDAYEYALTTICHNEKTLGKERRRYISAYILDIFLQMIDLLCTSGNVEKAIQKVLRLLENSEETVFLDVNSHLIVSDKCIFWVCCVYLAIYRKIPELMVQQFEFDKELPFEMEWPSAHLTPKRKAKALKLMKVAVDKMALDTDNDPNITDQVDLRPLHFLALCHIKCVAALEGLHSSADLLARYLSLYPTCIELILLSARLKETCTEYVVFKGFKESLSDWPKETSGAQCLWNQYIEHALSDKRTDLAETLLIQWFQDFSKDAHNQGDMFRLLNLYLYSMLQKNLSEVHDAIDKALKIASPQDFKHCVREHAAFYSRKDKSWGAVLGLVNGYLGDSRSMISLEPLSRNYYRHIKRPRVKQLVNNILGPVSKDFTLVNSILEVCFGKSLLPEKIDDPKGFVDFVESLMEITPTNFKLALSVYKLTLIFSHPSVATDSIKFWACTLLINSILQAVPVAAEYIWLEAASIMKSAESLDVSVRFHQQAVSVYPFSVELWQSYLDVSRNTDKVDIIVESARERGIELTRHKD